MALHDIACRITRHAPLGGDIFLLTVEAGPMAEGVRPGQFCMISVVDPESGDPLLRRPLSIYDAGEGTLAFLYRKVGRGTDLLSRHKVGESLGILGPLGRGFDLLTDRPCLLVGGGLGVAPLHYLARRLKGAARVHALLGGRSVSELPTRQDFVDLADEVTFSTDDGSLGFRGFVTGLLKQTLADSEPAHIYACGPWPMLREIQRGIRDAGATCQVSLEAKMACGIGLCLGCAVAKAGEARYWHVCSDGPVFPADAIDWELPA